MLVTWRFFSPRCQLGSPKADSRAAECLVKKAVEVFAMGSFAQTACKNVEGAFCASERNIRKAKALVRFFHGFLFESVAQHRIKSANFRWWKFKSPLNGSVRTMVKVHRPVAARRERTPVDLGRTTMSKSSPLAAWTVNTRIVFPAGYSENSNSRAKEINSSNPARPCHANRTLMRPRGVPRPGPAQKASRRDPVFQSVARSP